ncbi:hypothetical protein K505DRAFT_279031 [Melanomma pulvis-pyrius CBS 109.77]|uniref:Uncharacterized protein n=1 Tax=Melanomma pulvis-pyrius CBS 109.77 TaxID=1314802 RepID=A0A6A6X730_9PLEO|nr:hypothetical protein K505DRAFT_279031 [Melanomma pulvis-pyrius CBS 109.77]
MAPLRRYLRITKHSVLEVRIYLDRPSDSEGWLLRRDDPALPRVIHAVRPLVLPKLREENERATGRGGSKARKRGVKDVVVEDDFEVSVFLTELSSRHSVLTKQKIVQDKPRIQSNSGKLTNWLTTGTSEQPMVIAEDTGEPIIIREEDDNEAIILGDIPEAGGDQSQARRSTRNKRRRRDASQAAVPVRDASQAAVAVSDASDTDDSFRCESAPSTKRAKTYEPSVSGVDQGDDGSELEDDKKKLGINTSYDGFSIYGRILCLVVKRKGSRNAASGSGAMLENWVSTQAAGEGDEDDG